MCGVDAGAVMAELFGRDGGTCRGTGGSMHIYDMDTNFQGGWALVAEQLPYAVGAARSIRLDKHLNTGEGTAGRGFPKSRTHGLMSCMAYIYQYWYVLPGVQLRKSYH